MCAAGLVTSKSGRENRARRWREGKVRGRGGRDSTPLVQPQAHAGTEKAAAGHPCLDWQDRQQDETQTLHQWGGDSGGKRGGEEGVTWLVEELTGKRQRDAEAGQRDCWR